MNPARTSQAIRSQAVLGNRRGIRSALAIATIGILAILLNNAIDGVAVAQGSGAPGAERRSSELRYQAPIGARQPRPQDLPASVLRDEGRATASQRDFDKSLEICRDCGMNR
jgi:hypothetical protein